MIHSDIYMYIQLILEINLQIGRTLKAKKRSYWKTYKNITINSYIRVYGYYGFDEIVSISNPRQSRITCYFIIYLFTMINQLLY